MVSTQFLKFGSQPPKNVVEGAVCHTRERALAPVHILCTVKQGAHLTVELLQLF